METVNGHFEKYFSARPHVYFPVREVIGYDINQDVFLWRADVIIGDHRIEIGITGVMDTGCPTDKFEEQIRIPALKELRAKVVEYGYPEEGLDPIAELMAVYLSGCPKVIAPPLPHGHGGEAWITPGILF